MSVLHNLSPSNAANNLEALQQAAKNWDIAIIDELLKKGANYTATNKDGETVLHFALKNNPGNDSEILRIIETFNLFHKAGVDLNVKDVSGKTVLHIAFNKKIMQLTKMLIEWGAYINEPNCYGNTIAHFLVNSYSKKCNPNRFIEWRDTYCVDWLLSKGLDVDCRNHNGNTPIHLAAKRQLPHVLLTLLNFSKNANPIDEDGRTVLHIFMQRDAFLSDIMKFGSTPRGMEFLNETMRISVACKQLLLEKCSVDAVDFAGNTPVHIAASRKKLDLVRSMLEIFTNVNAQNILGETVLSILIGVCEDEELEKIEEFIELITILVNKGTNIHARRKGGGTPVQLAASRKHVEIFKVLLNHGANVDEFCNEGSLLHLVCKNANDPLKDVKYAELIDLLISKGCNVNAQNANGMTPLHLASKSATVAVIQRLIEHGADVDSRETGRWFTPLHLAVENYRTHSIGTLVYSKANINAKDSVGRTPLHLAARLRNSEMTGQLLELEADVNVKDNERNSALYYAIRACNLTAVKDLIKFGADVNDVAAFDYCCQYKDARILICIMKHWLILKTAMLPANDCYERHEKFMFPRFRQECVEEIETLKSSAIDNHKSLYDFLHLSRNARCAYTNDVEFCKAVTTSEFASKFPKYHVLVLAQYREAVKRKPLLKEACLNWFEITDIYLPDICIYTIFDHLANEDLKSLTEKGAIEHSSVKENVESFKRLKCS